MIFVTVGTQFPFDRLVDAVSVALENLLFQEECFAQVGDTSKTWPKIKVCSNLATEEFDRYINEASVVVSHAGMGTIIKCLTLGKPVLVMPRLSEYNEHRNDHQLDTLEQMAELSGVYPIYSQQELELRLEEVLYSRESHGDTAAELSVSAELVGAIKAVIG